MVLVAFAALVGLASLPTAATALTRVPASQAFGATPADSTGCFTDDSQSDFEAGTPNGCDLTSDPGSVQLSDAPPAVDQSNSNVGNNGVGITTTTWEGQTFTPDRTGQLTQVDVNMFCSGCTGTTPDLTLSIRATSGGLPTGADLVSATIAGFSNGPAAYHTATFASPITLTAGTQYAFFVHPTANPSLGTYALTRSGTSTMGADVYSGGARVVSANSGTSWQIPLTPQTGGASTDAGFNIWLQAGHVSSGTFVSSLKDADPPAGTIPTWTTLSFDATTPANTAVAFQVAASNSPTGPFTFVGPDGTPGTFFTTSGADLSQFDGFRYLEYEAFLSTTDSSTTPSVQSVQVCFDDTVVTSLAVAPASGTEGGTVDLSATLTASGSGLSGKTIDFTLNGNSVGSAVTTSDGTATLTNVGLTGITAGTYPGAVAASFAGDTDDEPSSGSNTLTVIGVPTVSSTVADAATGSAWAGTEVTGATAQDTATVTGDGGTPSGTVTYALYRNGSCSGTPTSTETKTLATDGSVPDSTGTGPLSAGSYSYQATYSGDANYTARAADCEPFTVAEATSSVRSVVENVATGSAWASTETTSASARDTSTVTGTAITPSGTVTYALYRNGSCSGTPTSTETKTLATDRSVPASTGTGPLNAGSYSYQATYSGDANYTARTADCEPFTVAKATPKVASAIEDTSSQAPWTNTEAAGASARDTSTVTGVGGFRPTGSMTYSLYGGEGCTGAAMATGQVLLNVDGTVPGSTATALLAAGSYSYRAAYSGDRDYHAATATCEPFTVAASSSSGGGSGQGGSARTVPFRVFGITPSRRGIVRFRLTVPRAGTVTVLETAWHNNFASVATVILLHPASRRFTFARAHLKVRGSTTVLVTVRPNARGRRLIAHHRFQVRIRLWVTYAVGGHRQGKKGFYGIRLTRKRVARA
jgi:hypothetical protein